jgi:hypothetical protein
MSRRRADVWLRRKDGRPDSWYFRRTRLLTKHAGEARERARLVVAGQWPPPDPARMTAAAFAIPAEPAPPPPPAPSPSPAAAPSPAAPPLLLTGEWTHAATGAAAEASAPADEPAPPPPPAASNEQLAELLVDAELTLAEIYVQQTVYPGFTALPIAAAGREILAGSYKTMLDYGGAALALPPWVQGLLAPAVTVLVSTLAIVGGWREQARAQKKTAEGGA